MCCSQGDHDEDEEMQTLQNQQSLIDEPEKSQKVSQNSNKFQFHMSLFNMANGKSESQQNEQHSKELARSHVKPVNYIQSMFYRPNGLVGGNPNGISCSQSQKSARSEVKSRSVNRNNLSNINDTSSVSLPQAPPPTLNSTPKSSQNKLEGMTSAQGNEMALKNGLNSRNIQDIEIFNQNLQQIAEDKTRLH